MLKKVLFVVAVLAGTAAFAGAVSAQGTAKKLKGEVGPGFSIEVKTAAGKDAEKVKAGKYTIVVEDKANIHDFHLVGRGVNKATGVAFKGKKTWKVTLKKGTYKYFCDPHKAQMHGTFKVT